ncbi:MAG: phytoene desaturase family protein [Candidatus Micrarchaeota archaeon]|nr:phytoene desaturase family protein [Candidatus Micrarchaeota archaeon]
MNTDKINSNSKKVIIIGAGPGGLSAAMLLAYRGFDVEVYEKDSVVGGRNKPLKLGDFTFDTGPTFLLMKFILDDLFKSCNRNSEDYLKFVKLDPMYRIIHRGKEVLMSSNKEKMLEEIRKKFPGNEEGYYRYLKDEHMKYIHLEPCLRKPYLSIKDMITNPFLKAVPYLELHRSVYQSMGKYFKDELLRLCFTFQSKYLGMSPWECPASFSMLSYVEHAFGIYHVIGGLNKISEAMARVAQEHGAKIHLNTKVKKLINHDKKVIGIELENNTKVYADYVVVNADFSYAVTNLMDKNYVKKYSEDNLKKKKFSCSTYMMYLCVDKLYDIPHHNIVFGDNYKDYVEDIFVNYKLPGDLSFYVQNACITDPTLAPKGKSTIYILVPVSNLRAAIDWKEQKYKFRDIVLDQVEQKTELKDLRNHIIKEVIITPEDWQTNFNVYIGATFNLAHTLLQMLYFRPHNKFECLDNVYLVGGGTHPGSGLPTIYESGRITANLITEDTKKTKN